MGRYPGSDWFMEEARKSTGLSDFGPGNFREGLDVLLRSLAEDAKLSPSSDANMVAMIKRRLVARLRVQAWLAQHPDVLEQPLAGPIDITGLTRTGTTALANMM